MTIQIVTDSTADLPDTLTKEYQISVVPLYVNIKTTDGLESLRDGIDIDHTTFYKTLANDDPSWKKNATEEGEIYSPPISEIEEAFVAAGAGAPATLQLVGVSYTTKAGQAVSFTKPVLKIAEAVAA